MQQSTDKELHEELTEQPATEAQATDNPTAEEQEHTLTEEATTEQEEAPQTETATNTLEAQLNEQKDKYLRLYSEFENFRRRTAKEKLEMIATAGEGIATAMLPVIDDFDRAMKNLPEEDVTYEGFQLIYHKLQKTLEQKGVKVMDITKGSTFDPDTMEAVTQFPAPEEELKGKVIEVIEKGYLMGDKVIRFAKVVTGA